MPAGRAASHHARACALAEGHDGGLDLDRVDGVDHVVERMAEQRIDVLHGDEIVDAADLGARVDLGDALGHRIDLGLAVSVTQRVDLAVGVGDRDVIEVDQRQPADAAPRECFGHP